MTTLTTNYSLRKPDGTDAASNVAIDNLADDVDSVLLAQLGPLSTTYRATTTLGVAAASVTFSSIPSTLKTVEVRWTARGDTGAINTSVLLRINGDSSTNYSGQVLQGANTSATASTFVTQSSAQCGSTLAASATAGRFGVGKVEITGWDSPHTLLNGIATYGAFDVAATNSFVGTTAFFYNVAGPYTSITLMPAAGNFVAGSEFVLIGWK